MRYRDGVAEHTSDQPAGAEAGAVSLTPKQAEVLEIIRGHVQRKGYPPTVREVMDAAGFKSSSSAAHHLKALTSKGFITRGPFPRTIRIVDPPATGAPGGEG